MSRKARFEPGWRIRAIASCATARSEYLENPFTLLAQESIWGNLPGYLTDNPFDTQILICIHHKAKGNVLPLLRLTFPSPNLTLLSH